MSAGHQPSRGSAAQPQGTKLAVIAAGGTGGHMFPAQALAEELLARGWQVRLSTDERGARYAGGFPKAVEVTTLQSATFARGGILAKLMVPVRLMSGALSARRQMKAQPPAMVIGFGGYPSIPALAAAWLLHLPRAIHEQNGVLGSVNRRFAPKVDLVACGTWPTEVPAGVTAEHIGNPVRAAIKAKAASPYPGVAGRLEVLVLGGSQGAKALSDHVPAALTALPDGLKARLSVSQQARPEDVDRVVAAYRAAGIAADVQSFFDDVPERMARASLVIARAGASTLADLTVIGRPSILVPYPFAASDHQTANAKSLLAAGAAKLMPESALTAQALAEAVAEILLDQDKAQAMAAAALALGKPEAAKDLADRVEILARKGS